MILFTDRCYMDYMWDRNAVSSLIFNRPLASHPPDYWFFGTFADEDYELCAEMCLQQEGCEAFALHPAGTPEYPNQCYGRSTGTTMLEHADMVSGVKVCLGKVLFEYNPFILIYTFVD